MILLLDNYDSFTFNLYQALTQLGADVEVVRNDQTTVADIEARLDEIDGIVISPGPCTPGEAGISVELIRQLAGKTPMLGVCLGHQAIGEAFGAVVDYAPYLMHGKVSDILHDGKGVYAGLPDPFTATRYHSLTIRPGTLPEELQVTAESPDGVIMGIRHTSMPIEGVQFHPESILTPHGNALLANFLRSTRMSTAEILEPQAVLGY
jgi:anthranilate synthase/aminodeoxychorismate synthase-like glutamine amidotransferase